MPLPSRVSDLTSFDLLLAVAELGSIGRAAAAQRMSQPAASARLRKLEHQLGVELVERGPRGARLTSAGELVVGWARPVVDRATDLEAGLAALRKDRQTHLRIAASMTVAEYLLPRWLIALRAANPATTTALSCGNSAQVTARVLTGDAQLGFIESPGLPAGVQAREVARDELAVVVVPSHRWARRRRVSATELARTPLVGREPGSGTRQAWEEAIRDQLDVDPAEPILEVSSTTALKAAAMGGIGPAVLSARAVTAELAEATLVRLAVPGLKLARRLHAIWPSGHALHGPARDLLAIALRGAPSHQRR
jgi:DNA-binding transcriptional LysR family regulator